MNKLRKYDEEAIRLAKAIDNAIESFRKYIPKDFKQEDIDHVISCYNEWKINVLNPQPKFKNITSLKYPGQIHDKTLLHKLFFKRNMSKMAYFYTKTDIIKCTRKHLLTPIKLQNTSHMD